MNKNYRRGMVKELEIKNYLERLGYISSRSAGSHSAFDVIAIPKDIDKPVLGIQVKRSKLGIKDISKHFDEVNLLKTYTFHKNIVILLWLYVDYEGHTIFQLKGNEFVKTQEFKHIHEFKIP